MRNRLITTGAGNLIDTAATLYLSHRGFTEANPAMAYLLRYPPLFALVKISAMTAVLVWLWYSRGSKYAQIASWVASATYGAIAVYYVWFFTQYT